MIDIYKFTFNPFGENTYLLVDPDTKEAAVVDPGMHTKAERDFFDRKVDELGANITQVINTHLHLDHCFGINYVKNKYGIPLKANTADSSLGKSLDMQSERFHIPADTTPLSIDINLRDGDEITVGESLIRVIHTPGHTPGGISLYLPENGVLISGDTLFQGSVGRTDLGGNHAQLISAIRQKLLTLPPSTKVLPGHGPATTCLLYTSPSPRDS